MNPRAAQSLLDPVRQGGILIDAQQQINLRQLGHQILFIALAEAARDDEEPALSGLLIFRHLQNRVDGFLLGGIDKAAGIHHQNVRLGRVGNNPEPPVPQQTQRSLRIHPVFIAAQGNSAHRICHGEEFLLFLSFRESIP